MYCLYIKGAHRFSITHLSPFFLYLNILIIWMFVHCTCQCFLKTVEPQNMVLFAACKNTGLPGATRESLDFVSWKPS
uniref:Uncharacterized protein n=1 Tax=Anguilla anguilla TaxID=7936 RepID=A0A0E9Q091_ANGAN